MSTVNLVFCFGPKIWFWTWTKLNNDAVETLEIEVGYPVAEVKELRGNQTKLAPVIAPSPRSAPPIGPPNSAPHVIAPAETAQPSLHQLQPSQDLSRKCSAWERFWFSIKVELNPSSLPLTLSPVKLSYHHINLLV